MQKLNRGSRSAILSAAVAVLFSASMSGRAQAQVTITYPGPGGFGQNVLFNQGPQPDGFHVNGVLNANSTFNVNFDSVLDVMHANGGQARIEPVDGRMNDVCVSLDPGFAFTRYIFNAYRDGLKGTVPLTVTAFWVGGPVGGFTSIFNINGGGNFVDVQANAGFLLTEVCISTPDLPDTRTTEHGFLDLRQNRIIGAQAIIPPSSIVPEGNSLAMLGLGGLPILGIVLRRRKTTTK
jgi:hypothetical protein